MKAMILAAGRGERMRPLTDKMPKSLVQVGSKPLILRHIEALARSNIRDIVINLCYLGEQIQAFLGDGSKWQVNIQYSIEKELLGTGGAILKALPLLGIDPFLIISADIWTDFPFVSFEKKLASLADIVLVDNPSHHPQGDFALQNGYAALTGERLNYGNIGMYHPHFFKECHHKVCSLGDLLKQAIAKKTVTASHYTGLWHNIGTIEQLNHINQVYF